MTNPLDPAFPHVERNDSTGPIVNIFHLGLSKREYFAAMVLQGLCARQIEGDLIINGEAVSYEGAAIIIADALIAKLSK